MSESEEGRRRQGSGVGGKESPGRESAARQDDENTEGIAEKDESQEQARRIRIGAEVGKTQEKGEPAVSQSDRRKRSFARRPGA